MTVTIADTLARRLEADSDEIFYIDGDERVSIGTLAEDVHRLARRLLQLGVEPGDAVVVWLPNGRLWIALFFACARIGAIVVTAGPRLRMADLSHMLERSGARALLYAPSFMGVDYDQMAAEVMSRRVAGELPALEHVVRCPEPSSGKDGARGRAPDGVRTLHGEPDGEHTPSAESSTGALPPLPDPPAPDAPAVICFTGGTTGGARGCVHDHQTLVENATIAAELTGFDPGERLVSAMPFAHVFGFHMSILQPMIGGASLVEAEPFDAGHALDLVARHRGTVIYGVPAMGTELVAAQKDEPRDLSSLRVALLAGAPVSSKLRRRAADTLACGVIIVYGATESPTLAQLTPDAPAPASLESVGRSTPGVELAIVEPDTSRTLPAGEIGEIAARGYNHMLGYLDDPDATAAKYRDGWIIPGDFGRLDENGYLYVVGRAEEMFLSGGFNVYPREIESQLELLDSIEEAVVLAVPDERLGEVGLAYVTIEAGGPSEDDIRSLARENMATYKRPCYVRILPAMPRTPVGKTARGELAERARADFPELDWSAS